MGTLFHSERGDIPLSVARTDQNSARSPLSHSVGVSYARHIPLDVWYTVILNLVAEADRSAILLVCRDWYHCFCDHRWPDLSIRSGESLRKICDARLGNARLQRRLQYTTMLRVHQRNDSSAFTYNTLFIVLGPHLPALRDIVFDGCIRPPINPWFVSGLKLCGGGIRSLTMSNFIILNISELEQIVLACPHLEALHLRHGSYPSSVTPPSHRPLHHQYLRRTTKPKLHTLELCCIQQRLFQALIGWFSTELSSSCRTITELTLSEVCGARGSLATQLLNIIGPSLRHLSIARKGPCARGTRHISARIAARD